MQQKFNHTADQIRNKNFFITKLINSRYWVVLAVFLAVCLFPSFSGLTQGSQRGLIISPPIIEATISEGQQARYTIRLENNTDTDSVKLKPYVNKVSLNEQDSPIFEKIEPSDPLSKLITISQDEVNLQPKEVKNLDFTITQPLNSSAGSLLAIIIEPITSDNAINGVNIKQRLSTLVFIQTPQKEGEPLPKFQVINAKSDLTIIDPFLDSYNVSYQLYNPTAKFTKVDPVVNKAPNDNSQNRKTVLPFGTRIIRIASPSPISLPEWLQNILSPRYATDTVNIKQNLSQGQIFGEQTFKLNNEDKDQTRIKVWFIPWKTTLLAIILITMLISIYYTTLWLLAKIKIRGKQLVSTPHISKRLPVIICFSVAFLSLTMLIVTQMSIPRIDVSINKIDTGVSLQSPTKDEISLNNNFMSQPIIVGRGFKTDIKSKIITIDDTNCQTPDFPPKVNGCYLELDISKVSMPAETKASSLIIGAINPQYIQALASSKDGQEIKLEIEADIRGEQSLARIDLANPNLDPTKPIQLQFRQVEKNRPITLDNLIISYK